jgi:predicted metal-dependent phosphoesterase TrpH
MNNKELVENYIDLHMHSIYSDDGEFTPGELLRQCKEAGLRIIAVTDHNCVRGNAEAQKEAERLNILYIPAVEIDCTCNGRNFHVIGYQIEYTNEDFKKIEQNILKQELIASKERLKKTNQLGFHITEDELNALPKGEFGDVWTGEMFAEILLGKAEYNDHELLRPYRKDGSRSDNPYVNFYWDFYAQGKPCYTEIKFPTVEETVSLIHRNGGKAVLAHPGLSLKGNNSLLDEIIACGIDGIEAFSSYHDQPVSQYFYDAARKNNLIVTCGSDYHGKNKPSVKLGHMNCSIGENDISLLVN